MNGFKKFRRTQIAEIREVTELDLKGFENDKVIYFLRDTEFKVSISDTDLKNGSPKLGDMIARNPINHNDQWLIAEQYFKDNFEYYIIRISPKEKAKELVNRFYSLFSIELENTINTNEAIECALIAVDEILGECIFDNSEYTDRRYKYYLEVRLELEDMK